MSFQEVAAAYLGLCEEFGWTPSVKGLVAWVRIREGGYFERWRTGNGQRGS